MVAQEARPRGKLQPAQPQLAFLIVRQVSLNVARDFGVPVRKPAQAKGQSCWHHRLQAIWTLPAHDRVTIPLRALKALGADAACAQHKRKVTVWTQSGSRLPGRLGVQQGVAIVTHETTRAVAEGGVGGYQLAQVKHAAVESEVYQRPPPRSTPP